MRKRQPNKRSGHMFLELALVAILLAPMLAGGFGTGINLIRSIQVNHMARDLADMYIHGTDFSNLGMQQIANRLATGLGLEVGAATTGTNANNTSNAGTGIVWVTKLMWVGATNQPNCVAVAPANCTNTNKFVVLEHIKFGNGTLTTYRNSGVGSFAGARDPQGRVTVDKVTDATAAVPEPYQTSLYNLWQVTNATTNRVALADGQQMYMVEVYFRHTGSFAREGIYSRWFF